MTSLTKPGFTTSLQSKDKQEFVHQITRNCLLNWSKRFSILHLQKRFPFVCPVFRQREGSIVIRHRLDGLSPTSLELCCIGVFVDQGQCVWATGREASYVDNMLVWNHAGATAWRHGITMDWRPVFIFMFSYGYFFSIWIQFYYVDRQICEEIDTGSTTLNSRILVYVHMFHIWYMNM